MLDERDRKILDLLQADAEMAVNDIADAVALSASACSRRITRLREGMRAWEVLWRQLAAEGTLR